MVPSDHPELVASEIQTKSPLLTKKSFTSCGCSIFCYHPRMREGNVFILSVYVSVCMSVRAKTFECLDIEASFFVW